MKTNVVGLDLPDLPLKRCGNCRFYCGVVSSDIGTCNWGYELELRRRLKWVRQELTGWPFVVTEPLRLTVLKDEGEECQAFKLKV